MLTKLILENFKSFKHKTEFDLEATKYQTLQETNVVDNVLRGALIVGPNASGKSTLIDAVRTLLDLLFADNFTIDTMISCLFCNKNNISLTYNFKIEGNFISYSFEIDKKGVVIFEQLILNKKVLLERKALSGRLILNDNETQLMDNLFSEKILLLRKCYFSDMFAGNKIIIKFMEFLRNSVYINANDRIALSYNNISHLITEIDADTIKEINKLFCDLDFGFIISKAKEKNVSEIVADGKKKHYVIKSDEPIIFFKRNDMNLYLPLEMESAGNQTLANMIPSILYCSKTESLLLIDEFSSGFHNKLEEILIKYLLLKTNKTQLIFTSHSTNLLNTRLLRPDQIYTVNFTPNEGSYIERFSDENPREAQNLEKMYLSGKFGAIPNYKL